MIIEHGKRDFKVNVNLIVYVKCYFEWKAVVPIAKKNNYTLHPQTQCVVEDALQSSYSKCIEFIAMN